MADVTKSILFTIGTVGAGKATQLMGGYAAAIGAASAAAVVLGKQLVEAINQGVRFKQVVDSVNIPLGEFNRKTAGLVDTMATYQAAARLQNAQVKISGEQFAALGAAATRAAQAAGEGPEGATTRFERLTKAIIAGRETALKEYGIEVSQTTDLVKFQSEALEKLTGVVGDFTAAAETAEERWSSFGNTLGTVIDFRMAQGGKELAAITEALLGGGDALRAWEKDLVNTRGELAAYYSIIGDGATIELANNEAFLKKIRSGEDWRRLSTDLYIQGQLNESIAVRQAGAYLELAGALQSAAIAARSLSIYSQKGARTAAKDAEAGAVSGLQFTKAYAQIARPNAVKGARPTGGGRGGGRGGGSDGVDPVSALLDAPMGRRRSGIGAVENADSGAWFGGSDPLNVDLSDMDGSRAVAEQERIRQQEINSAILEEQRLLNEQMRELYEQDQENRRRGQEIAVSTTVSTFDNIGRAIGKSSEAAFNAQKAFLIPAAIIEGTMASLAAFRSVMQTVPFPANVIIAPAYAASIAAVTATQVAAIAGQKYGGSSKGGKPSGAGSISQNFSGGALGSGGGSQGTTVVNNIIVEGQTIQTSVVRANERAAQNGSPAFAMEQ